MKRIVAIGRRGTAKYIADAERRHQTELDVVDLRREVLADRVRSLDAELERCRRNHTDLSRRNSTLQATNVQLAHRLEQAELRLAQRGLA